jgi:membrane-bound serine protease (ClpP class)
MKKRIIDSFLILILIASTLALAFSTSGVSAKSNTPNVVIVHLDGPLTPVWKIILQRGIDLGTKNHSAAVIVELNTTGGSIDLMTNLIQQIIESPTPVVMYVSPKGSMAASAGTLLTLAGKVSAMAPETILGAASPVGSQGEDLTSTETLKTKEALKATARSLIASRGSKAVALAEQAIDDAKAASADEALSAGLIDIIANDEQDLLQQLDGRTVLVNGSTETLHTLNAEIIETPITQVENILGLLTNPNIIFVLLAVGSIAVLIEMATPGGWVAGFTGVILLALGIYGLGLLPVNWVGIIFILAAFVLYVLDIKAPTHGALTVAGTGSFIAGGLILFNSASVPSFANVSVPLVVGMGIFVGGTFMLVVMLAVRVMKTPVVTGKETMAGREGYAVSAVNPAGIVQVAGERWSARRSKESGPIAENDRVVVDEVQGLKLIVSKKK